VKPNRRIESAICRIWRLPCVRALRGAGFNLEISIRSTERWPKFFIDKLFLTKRDGEFRGGKRRTEIQVSQNDVPTNQQISYRQWLWRGGLTTDAEAFLKKNLLDRLSI
jgi:hypothetical protein